MAQKLLHHEAIIDRARREFHWARIQRLHAGRRESLATNSTHTDVHHDLKRMTSHAANAP